MPHVETPEIGGMNAWPFDLPPYIPEFLISQYERVRLLEGTWRDIAYPPVRWKHHGSFAQDGRRFDIWLNWDGRARIECEGEIVLRFWAPAAQIFRDIEKRRQGFAAEIPFASDEKDTL